MSEATEITEELRKAKEYWYKKLNGINSDCLFQFDNGMPTAKDDHFDYVGFDIGGGTFDKLIHIINNSDIRLYMILVSVIKGLLCISHGCSDTIIGASVLRQENKSIDQDGMLCLRDIIFTSMSFKEILLASKRTVTEAYENSKGPVVNDLPIPNIAVALKNIHNTDHLSKYSMSVVFVFSKLKDRLRGEIRYKSALYKNDTINKIANEFANLLSIVLHNLDMPLVEIGDLTGKNHDMDSLSSGTIDKKDIQKRISYPVVEPDIENINVPFQLTDVQMAYLMGRNEQFELGGVSTHFYIEMEVTKDIGRLSASLNRVIRQNPVLRSIILKDGRQQILKEVPEYAIEVEDISMLTAEEQERRILEERERMSHCIFQTDCWPLFEFKALKLSENINQLFVGFDLLISDAASMYFIGKQLLEFYDKPELEPVETQMSFRDYALAYHKIKETEAYANDRKFWLDRIDGFPPAPALPLKQEPSCITKPHFSRVGKRIEKSKWEKLKKKAQQNNVTPSMLLCSAYAELLGFWSNQPRLTINLAAFNRYPFHEDVNKIIGDFTTVMLVDVDLQKGSTFWERARQVQDTFLKVMEHRHYDGVEFIRELSARNGSGTKAIMPVVFTSILFGGTEGSWYELGDIKMGISQTSQVYLDNQVMEIDGELRVNWDYVDDLFEQDSIGFMFDQYICVLESLADGDEVYEFELDQKDRKLLEKYNDTEEELPVQTLHRLFMEQARRSPHKTAVISEKGSLSYEELDRRSNYAARYLKENGTGRNDFVGVRAERDPETIAAIIGILKAGAAYIPIDPGYPEERKKYILDNSGCKMILEPGSYMTESITSYTGYDAWEEEYPEDTAYIIYTSGSTGKPKGVIITHHEACNTIIGINRKFNINQTDKIIGLSSMCFDLSVYDIFGALSAGATLVMVPDQRDMEDLRKVVEREKITVWNSVPAIMDMMVESLPENYRNESLRLVMMSGDWIPLKLPEKVKEKFAEAETISLGGATEGAIWSIYYPIEKVCEEWKSIPYGWPLANQKLYILNYRMESCPVNVTGELYIGGVGVAEGYINDEGKTTKAFINHPVFGRIYRTGDYGVFRAEGYIEFLGRKDSQVKIRGYRIELGEIETCLLRHEAVRHAVVIDRIDEWGKKYLCAYIAADREMTSSELRTYISDELPDYMVPSYFMQMEEIPLTSNGKVDRISLPEPEGGIRSGSVYEAPRNETEEELAQIWSDVLGMGKVGVNDNFFELGGDSLKAQLLINRIQSLFNVKISIRDFFAQPTVAMAGWLILTKAGEESSYPVVEPDIENINVPFQLTDVQMAYLMGRNEQFELGGVSTHFYIEMEVTKDIGRLSASLNRVIRQNPVLRSIILKDGRQQILKEVPEYAIEVEDISMLTAEEQERRILEERERMSHCIFQTDCWPLFEFKALKLSENINQLFVGFDLLISDAASMYFIGKQLLEFYDKPELEPVETQMSFRDYALAYHKIKETEAYANDRKFWLDRIDGFPPAPALPLKQEPSCITKPHFSRVGKRIEKSKWEKLKKKAQQNNVTPSMLLCSAYAELLGFWSNQPRLTINLAAFNRYPFHEDVNKIIGDFTTVMLVDVDLQKGSTFWERARQVQDTFLKVMEHRHYDGVEFIRELSARNGSGTKAIMPVVFTSILFGGTEGSWYELGDIKMGISQTSQVYLDNQVMEIDGELRVNWDYVDDLFEQDSIGFMFDQYICVLESLADGDEVYEFELDQKDRKLLEKYNDTEEELPVQTLHRLFMEQARRSPHKTAVISEKGSLSYEELDRRSNYAARYLKENGTGRNDFVGVRAERDPETIAAIIGILKAGAAYIPIDPGYPEERKKYILDNSGCKMILEPGSYMTESITSYTGYDAWEEEYPEDTAYIIYTSGSTGKPKGVIITHHEACNTIIGINRKFNINQTDKIIGLSSMCFDLSVYDIFGALSAGATLVMVPDQRDMEDLRKVVEREKITVWNSVPAIMDMMVESLPENYRNESLRLVMMSGDWIPLKLPEKVKEKFAEAETISLGGATEGAIWSIYYPIEKVCEEWKSIPYGWPLANQKLYILNYRMESCPVNVTGELYIGGVGVAEGYINDEGKTTKAFINHPVFGRIYRTGDYGVFRAEGYIEFLGRKDSQVKIRGYRIELGEIETCLLRHEAVRHAVVIDRIDEWGKKYLCAYIAADREMTSSELRTYISDELPDYMVPSYFMQMEEIPLTSNGKVDRISLPEPEGGIRSGSVYEAPRNETEEELAQIWSDVLGMGKVGVNDNFFELGGDSLKAQLLINRIQSLFNVKISIRDFFAQPTVAMAGQLMKAGANIYEHRHNEISVNGDVQYFWAPGTYWKIEEDKARIGSNYYGGFIPGIIQKIYFLTQEGITIKSLITSFADIDEEELRKFVMKLIEERILICSLPTPDEIFRPINSIFTNAYDSSIIYDTENYSRFKQEQLNRDFEYCSGDEIELLKTIEYPEIISQRRSYRSFSKRMMSYNTFSDLLSIFKQNRKGNSVSYYYASDGGLYPIDVFVYVKKGKVEGIGQGIYYYNPVKNSLRLVDDEASITDDVHLFTNKDIFNLSSFTVFLVYDADVNMPKYGANGYFLACLDAGIMTATFTYAAEAAGAGICSIGDMNFSKIAKRFRFKENQIYLHSFEVGLKPEASELGNERSIVSSGWNGFIEPQPKKQFYPVSSAQKRIYMLHHIEDCNTAYNNPTLTMVEGKLDIRRLEDTFKKIIKRHEILRTAFEIIDGEPVQIVHDDIEFSIDYNELSIRQLEKKDINNIINDFVRPFDLSRSPLIRVKLIKLIGDRSIMLCDMHHIIADGSSVGILVQEFMDIYMGKSLPELRIQYKDYSQWHNSLLHSDYIKHQEDSWLKIYKNKVRPLNMPVDYHRQSAINILTGDTVEFELPCDKTSELKKLICQKNVTLYMMLLAAYNVLLSKYSGQEDIVIGTTLSGRTSHELEGLIGMFVNMLPMRNYPSAEKSFSEFLDEVRESTITAFDNQEYQFEMLIQKLELDRDPGRMPLIDTVFVVQSFENLAMSLGDLKFIPYDIMYEITKYELVLEAREKDGKIHFLMHYSTSLYKRETIERLCGHYIEVIENILQNQSRRLIDFNLSLENTKESTDSKACDLEGRIEFDM